MSSIWSGFYKKSLAERQQQLELIYPIKQSNLSLDVANNMIENCIGLVQLPLGLIVNLNVNNNYYQVPMCVEEPSVIAACCNAVKLLKFNTSTETPSVIAQVLLLDIPNSDLLLVLPKITDFKVLEYCNSLLPSMVKRVFIF